MSNYTPIVNYAPKDALTTGDPAKKIRGTELAAEFNSISSMSATKEDLTNKNVNNGYCGLNSSALVDDARLTSNIPRLNVSNVFVGTLQTLSGSGSVDLRLTDSTAAANEKIWAFRSASGVFQLFTVTDGGAGVEVPIILDRTGTTVDSIGLISPIINLTGAINLTGLVTTSTNIELGHASDTTLSRVSPGLVAVEGINLVRQGDSLELGHASDTTLTRIAAGRVAIEGIEVGFRQVPRSTTSGTAVAADVGRCIAITAGLTIPNSVFVAGDAISIYNDSSGNLTITQGSGLTMRLVGTATTGSRTLAQRGLATIWFNTGSECVISGGGLT